MKTLAQQALAAGHIHISGTEGSILIVAFVVGVILLLRRRGSDTSILLLVGLGVIIALALLGGWHLYQPHIP